MTKYDGVNVSISTDTINLLFGISGRLPNVKSTRLKVAIATFFVLKNENKIYLTRN